MNHKISIGCLIPILLFLSCRKDRDPAPSEPSGVHYRDLNLQVNFNESKDIDLNEDGKVDLQFYSESHVDPLDRLDAYLIRCLQGHQITQVQLTDNPLFNATNVMSYNENELIGEPLPGELLWGTGNGILAMRHTSTSIAYIGRWSDGNEKMMALKLNFGGKAHFGWLRAQYNRQQHTLLITGFAYQKKAGDNIKAGQVRPN
jgi:hypothetical protein